MMRFVVGYDRSQISLFPGRLDDYLDEEECRAFTLRETSGEERPTPVRQRGADAEAAAPQFRCFELHMGEWRVEC
jgi:hypothetical protein